MDQPQHQVFGGNNQSYRYMAYPFKRQPLQLLYPGRLMQNDFHYTGENIDNEDPEGLDKSRADNAALAKAAEKEEAALSRHLGGKDKIIRHPAVEPEAIIEDPAKRNLSVSSNFNVNSEKNPYLENPHGMEKAFDDSRAVKKEITDRTPKYVSKTGVPDRYNWRDSIEHYSPLKDSTGRIPIHMIIFVILLFLLIFVLAYKV